MKNFAKKFTTVAVVLICAAAISASASAASITSAVSVGVKYNSDGIIEDFVPNARNAKNAYDSISSCTNSVLMTAPTKSQLEKYLDSDVVFLNSHGHSGVLYFTYNFGSQLRDIQVKSKTTDTSYVSISDLDLSNVKLIQFFSCLSATPSSISGLSLMESAYNSGAELSVGFTGSIVTRSDEGQAWLAEYNNKLSHGHSFIASLWCCLCCYTTN